MLVLAFAQFSHNGKHPTKTHCVGSTADSGPLHTCAMDPRRTLRVLVVDDDRGMRALIVRATSHMHLELAVCASVREALVALSRQRFDFIITDYLIGDGTGADVVSAAGAVPAILITGTVAHVPESQQSLFVDILEKPFRLSALFDAIDGIRHVVRTRRESGTAVRDVAALPAGLVEDDDSRSEVG